MKDKLTKKQRLIWLIPIIIIITMLTAKAQGERFTLSFSTELADKNTHNDSFDYGFNIGANIALQHDLFYVRARTFYFPELNGIDYFDFDGGGGFNFRNNNDNFRVYLGAFIGAINRLGWGHGKTGVELGVEVYLNKSFFIGLKADQQRKHDDKIYRNNESGHTVKSLSFQVGLVL